MDCSKFQFLSFVQTTTEQRKTIMDLLALNRIIQDNTPSTSTTTPSTFTPAHIGAPTSSTSSTSSRDDESKTETYVFFIPHSSSHLFNKLKIHTTFMIAYTYPLFLVTRSLIHKLTQAIMHNYLTLELQRSGNSFGFGQTQG